MDETGQIELYIKNEIQKTPDPAEFAAVVFPQLDAAIEKAKTPDEANELRAITDMALSYVKQKLPQVVQGRHERYSLMLPGEMAYVKASGRAGQLWAACDNKRPQGQNESSEKFQKTQGVIDVGFKGHKDAMTCVRIGELHEEDLRVYFEEMEQDERHVTVHGAERIWRLLNPSEATFEISGLYRVIYADPPWQYGNLRYRGATEQSDYYPLMTTSQICDIPVSDYIYDDAVLFLWATSPILYPDAFKVMDAWGFEYKSSFIWDKVKHNMGYYNSVRHEFLLIGTHGSCTPDVVKLFDSVQEIERGKGHSEKPEKFREIINTLYPEGPRAELFARKEIDGWDCYGNEISEKKF